jgi:hypothetical protein
MYIGGDIVRDGLVLHLDAGSERSYPKSGNVWKDLSGNGNNGILSNGPTFNSGNGESILLEMFILLNYIIDHFLHPKSKKTLTQQKRDLDFNNK